MRRFVYLAIVSVLATVMVLPSVAVAQQQDVEGGSVYGGESGGGGGAAPAGPALPVQGGQGGGGDQGGGGGQQGGQQGGGGGQQGSGGQLAGTGGLPVVPLAGAAVALLVGSGILSFAVARRR